MNFSYDELVKLENEAMNRVRKINENERNTAQRMNESINASRNEPTQKRQRSQPDAPNTEKLSFLSDSSPDTMLLLAVLLLLSREKSDSLLLLAMLYILM